MASSFTDFKSGLENVNDYLSGKHHLSGAVSLGSDALKIVAGANYSFSLRELICSVLGGHPFNLPNIQISIFANINALLGLDKLQAAIQSALAGLADAFSSFMDSLSIDSVLGKLNTILGEAINVANMINFCGKPINPVAIPNMIEGAFGSLLGKGDAIITKIGFPPISESLSFDSNGDPVFSVNAFINDSGVLGDIARNYDAISIGEYGPASAVDELVNKINNITNEINELVAAENNIKGAYDIGGSDFAPSTSDVCSTKLGILHNPSSGGIADNTRIAASLKGVYDQLAGYPVQYINQTTGEVTEYPNIFHTFVTPEVLAILDQDVNDNTTVAEQIPVFDYCGNIIGYTTNTLQGNPDQRSEGNVPSNLNCPGDPANVKSITGYEDGDPRLNQIYPGTSPQRSPSDATITDGVSSGVLSADADTGFSQINSNEYLNSGAGSDDYRWGRKWAGNFHYYQNEIETYDASSGNVELRVDRRSRGNYVTKHAFSVSGKNVVVTFKDHNRKDYEYGYFELMVEHLSDTFTFTDSIIWDGGTLPNFASGNLHIIEFRNYGQAKRHIQTNTENIWLGKLVGSFPISI